MSKPPRCDFCGAHLPEHPWAEPAYDVQADLLDPESMGVVQVNSKGEWLACDPCHYDIEQGNRKALTVRLATEFIADSENNADEAERASLMGLAEGAHSLFWENRTGEDAYRTNVRP